jgi:hypothetical protein
MMKQSVIEFGVKFTSAEPVAQHEQVKEKLKAMPGVLSVESSGSGSLYSLRILINFEDTVTGRQLHRKLMKALLATDLCRITRTTTTLTDFFDGENK